MFTRLRSSLIIGLSLLSLACSCATHSKHHSHENESMAEAEIDRKEGYRITFPAGWKRVTDPALVKRRVLWSMVSEEHSWTYQPDIDAWDAPEDIDGFLTAMRLKQLQDVTFKDYFDEIIFFLKKNGFQVQENGVVQIGSHRSKWWVLSLPLGDTPLYQQCYMVPHKGFVYFFVFTTTYLSKEKMETFKTIATSIKFQE